MAIEDIQLKQSDAYLSNPNLKRADTPIQWTGKKLVGNFYGNRRYSTQTI